MADVTGPISTLPGANHSLPEGTMCDDHPDRPAYRRIQGETDSFGAELHDLCKECCDEHDKAVAEADTSGCCDWCNQHKPRLRKRRDYDEGMAGPVYDVCDDCIAVEVKRLAEDEDDDCYVGNSDYDWGY